MTTERKGRYCNQSDDCESEESESDNDNDCVSDLSDADDDGNESIIANVTMKEFPVNLIFLEKMDSTLDHYMMNNELSDTEWKSILFQIVVACYAMSLTKTVHNDIKIKYIRNAYLISHDSSKLKLTIL